VFAAPKRFAGRDGFVKNSGLLDCPPPAAIIIKILSSPAKYQQDYIRLRHEL
jgi:hypothetical protein